jgi:hypothetical protein
LLSAITAKQVEGRRGEESAAAAREVVLKKTERLGSNHASFSRRTAALQGRTVGAGSAAEIYILKLKKAEEGNARFNTRTAAARKNLRILAAFYALWENA